MATTIARLAAVLSTDTGQFQAGFDRAGVVVRRFQQRTEGGGGSLAEIVKHLAHTQHGAEKASGSLLKMAAFGFGGGLPALVALIGALGYKAYEAQNKFDEASKKIIEDIQAMRAEANAGPITLPRDLTQESWLQELKREMSANIREIKEFWGVSSGPEAKSTLERLEELKKKTADWLTEQKKLRAEEEKASAARAREMDKLKASADSITKAFRTPAEIWGDTINEITRLTQLGLLNLEQYHRAVLKANEDLDKSNEAARKVRDVSSSSVSGTPALSKFSPEAFSAIQAAAREAEKQSEINRQQLAIETQQQKELEAIRSRLQSIPVLGVKVGRL